MGCPATVALTRATTVRAMRHRRARSAVVAPLLALVLPLALAGCSEETPSADPTPAVSSSEPVPTSDTIEGVPVSGDGWVLGR